MIVITMSGLPMSTKSEYKIIGQRRPVKSDRISDEPNITKKMRMKKSRRYRILLPIWKWPEELASDNPARKPPISIENPTLTVNVAMRKHQARLVKNKSSLDVAILSKMRGIILRPSQSIRAKKITPLIMVPPMPMLETLPPAGPKLAKKTRRIMATKSCTKRKPTLILP